MLKLGLVSLFWLGIAGAVTAADFSLGTASRLTLSRNTTNSVAIGDANGDGRLDLAVVESAEWQHRLELYLQRDDGSLAPPLRLDLWEGIDWGFPVAFVDTDHDGVDEIMVGTSDLVVARYEAGALTTVERRPVRYGCAYLAEGDIDSDGNVDVVCHSGIGTPRSATIFYGNGAGGFRSTLEMLTGVGSYGSRPDLGSIRLADVNDDDRLDLLVTASRVGSFFVYPNNGAGGFAPGTAYAHPASPAGVWPAAIEALDIDGDGINEVVTASPENGPDAWLNVYRLGENGYLALSERLPTRDSTTALLAADMDGDGDKELLAGHFYFHAVTVLGSSAPGLSQPMRYELPGFGNDMEAYRLLGTSKAFALGDINGDGCVDLAAATYSGITLMYGCRPYASRTPTNDFDGDGVSDLIWQSVTSEAYLWQWADIDAWKRPGRKIEPWRAQVFGDFNGDGSSDVFWRNRVTGENAILLSALYERPITTVTSQDWQVVGAGDFDGDDQSDLLWRNTSTGANAIWKSGDYRSQQTTRSVTDLRWQVAGVGDFDGDGRSDILWRHSITGKNAIWLAGRFEIQQPVTAVTNTQWHVHGVGDFNKDGRDDIVWRNVGTGANVIWYSGDYSTQKGIVAVTNQDWSIAAVGDYNGDGVSDLFWRNDSTGANVVWRSADYKTQQAVAAVPLDAQSQLLPY